MVGENGCSRGPARSTGRGAILGILGFACIALAVVGQNASGRPAATTDRRLDELARHLVSGGPPKDGIPPVDEPKFVSAREAERFLHDEDIVFGVNRGGVVRAYPQHVLVWHEIVNETSGGRPVSVTYCPFTGSAIGFFGSIIAVRAALYPVALVGLIAALWLNLRRMKGAVEAPADGARQAG